MSDRESHDETPADGDVSEEDPVDQVDAKGFAEYVLKQVGLGKKKPTEEPPAPEYRQTLSSSDQDGEERVVWSRNTHPDDEQYFMRHPRRGVALIFNHTVFRHLEARAGSDKDCKDLEIELDKLGFDVRVHNNLVIADLRLVLDKTSKEDHSDADCLLVFVMSHGQPGVVFAKDSPYKEDELWSRFVGAKCGTLAGKPKLFFIQACRGDRVDSGVRVATDCTDGYASFKIPSEADILLAYSTVKEYYAWRSPLSGSWYVQALCEELRVNGKKRDLLTILTFVNRRVAIDYISNVPKNEKMNMKVQMPTFTSRLTRQVFFQQGEDAKAKRKRVKS